MKVLLSILKKIIEKKVGDDYPYKNHFSVQLYNRLSSNGITYFDNMRFIDEMPSMESELGNSSLDTDLNFIENFDQVYDLRIRALKVNGFRMFPYREDEPGWGLNLESGDDPKICSLFLVGDNGTGKTSLYSAVEYDCTNRISSAEARGIKKKFYTEYITHAKSRIKPEIKLLFKDAGDNRDKQLKIEDIKELLPAFFCSENEINDFCHNAYELTEFFYCQTGYFYLYKLRNYLLDEKKIIEENEREYNLNHKGSLSQQLSNADRLSLLDNIQGDAIRWIKNPVIEPDNELSLLEQLKVSSQYIQELGLQSKQIVKQGRRIFNLQKERDLISQNWGKDSTLYRIYDEIFKFWQYSSDLTNKEYSQYIPHRYKEKEKAFYTEAIDFNLFFNKRNYIVNWYEHIFSLMKDDYNGSKEKWYLSILKEINKEIENTKDKVNDFSEDPNVTHERYQTHKGPLVSLIKAIDDELEKIRLEIEKTASDMKEKIFSDFLDAKCEELDIRDDNEKMVATLYFGEKRTGFEPREYLNSFRFKFYCVLLKIVAAFTVKKCFKINFPMIFDDIFYSSDFINRDKVGDFISSIYEIHDHIFSPSEHSPLQMIFFTHDELILEAAMKNTSHLDNIIYGRLFPYEEMIEEEVTKVGDMKFYNLYIPFTNG